MDNKVGLQNISQLIFAQRSLYFPSMLKISKAFFNYSSIFL
ncbi:hypothetical protein CMALT394_540008 [Carnobacterium maltaromaticum]|nr:hypothetical protein CMALT394_540008 [Carnobacterium maltaromaticum]